MGFTFEEAKALAVAKLKRDGRWFSAFEGHDYPNFSQEFVADSMAEFLISEIGTMLRWTVFRFPSQHGTPKSFRWRWMAWLHAQWVTYKHPELMCELQDKKTGAYRAYWI